MQSFPPFPNLSTDRLVLRQIYLSDDSAIYSIRSNDEVNRYIDRPKQQHIKEARSFIKMVNEGIEAQHWYYWAISQKENSSLIGTICLWNFSTDRSTAELGYELDPAFQGKGIMSESVECVIQYGLQVLGLQTLHAHTHQHNQPSIHLLLKHHFVPHSEQNTVDKPNLITYTLNKK